MSETRPAEAWNNVNSDVVTQFRSDNGKISSGMFQVLDCSCSPRGM
jgi:hypothetical protein